MSDNQNKLTQLFSTAKATADERDGIYLPPAKTLIRANLDNTRPYDRNPRQSVNEKYESIKESIRNTGMEHPPNITARPGDDYYMVRDGGNTRIQILNELWEETKDPKYYEFDCTFHPWEGDLKAIAKHMAENEERGGTLFIDRALAAQALREEILLEDRLEEISIRALAIRISSEGWTVDHSSLSLMFYATEHLLELIPAALWGGVGRDILRKIRKLEKASVAYWNELSVMSEGGYVWDEVWNDALTQSDSEEFSYTDLHTTLCSRVRDAFSIDGLGEVGAEIDAILGGHSRENVFPTPTPTLITTDASSTKGDVFMEGPSSPPLTQTSAATQVSSKPSDQEDQPLDSLEDLGSTRNAIPDAVLMLLRPVCMSENLEQFVTFTNEGVGFEVDLASYAHAAQNGMLDPLSNDSFAFKAETILAVLAQIRSTASNDQNLSINEDICLLLFNGNWKQMAYQMYLGSVVGEVDPNVPYARVWHVLTELKSLISVWNAPQTEDHSTT